MCLTHYLCGAHRTGVCRVQVHSAVGLSRANPAAVPAWGLTAALPLERPLGNDSTGQLFPRRFGWDVCTALLVVRLHHS